MSATDRFSPASGQAIQKMLETYQPQPGSYDELLGQNGEPQPIWDAVLERFARMSISEQRTLRDSAQRMLHDNGVTYVAQDDAGREVRPWHLDLLPLLIAPQDWAILEAGLVQRTHLLNEILVDLYGPQKILSSGTLPPSVIFGNQQFLRPACNVEVKRNTYVYLAAFDVARAPNGQWWVLSDRTEAPSGAGYALENRVVSSNCLAGFFESQNVRRQASFFRDFNEHFLSVAQRDEPVAVFLTRGPAKRNYFEHAYLARYLGYNIVEGSDLTVRNEKLFIKTVEGLTQVDLVLRTVRSDMCDPLEMRPDSLIGVPGLMQAVRAGHVTIGNALGTGIVESDAFLGFLPALCRYFLGQDLLLPSVATWWCGQENEMNYVLDHLDDLIIRRVSSTRSVLASGQHGQVEPSVTPEGREELKSLIRTRGYDFVGQERFPLPTAPVWTEKGKFTPAPIVMRVFVAATDNGYAVMPGALTRISLGSDPRTAWLMTGDFSKDSWVLSSEPVEPFSMLAQRHDDSRLRRGGRDLPSRTADNLFWLGRYVERAEAAVRLFRSLVIRLYGETSATRLPVSPERIVALLIARKHLSAARGRRAGHKGAVAVESELWSILFDPESRDGLAAVLRNVRRNAEIVRERLSFDAFRILRDLTDVPAAARDAGIRSAGSALPLLNRLIQHLAAFNGMVMENMTRGYGWRFLDMGRRIERVRTLTQLLQQIATRGNPAGDGGLDLMLELADSTMTYRGRYHATPTLARSLDLLLADDTNPRSMLYQLQSIDEHLRALPHGSDAGLMTQDRRIAVGLASELSLADLVEISEALSAARVRVRLERLLRSVDKGMDDLSDLVTQRYFSHSSVQRVIGDAHVK